MTIELMLDKSILMIALETMALGVSKLSSYLFCNQ